MKISKSWLIIILFSFSLSIVNGFSLNLHQDIVERSCADMCEVHDASHDISCDACYCSHVKSMLNDVEPKISHICTTKPRFEFQKSILTSNRLQLIKPPIS